MADLNVIEKANLFRDVARIIERINVIERKLSGDQIDSVRIKDAAITNAKIDSLTWDKGQGGTLSLGGAANVDGVLSLKDASDVEKILFDKDGITITDGKITVKDSSDTTIIDAFGLVSTANFANDSVSASNVISTTSTSFIDVDSITLTTPTLSREANILILFTVQAAINTSDGSSGDWFVLFILDIDGVEQIANYIGQGGSKSAGGDQNGVGWMTPTIHAITSLAAGSHVIKVKWEVVNNSGTGKAYAMKRTLSYVLLGN